MNDTKQKIKTYLTKLKLALEKLRKYSLASFLVFVALLYGFVLLRVNTLANTEPTDEQVTSQVKAAQVPHIDDEVVKQLKSLQDNSVNVKALFDEARSNPFQ